MILSVFLGMFGLGGQEITLIAVVLLLMFGGRKIPELMRGLGKGIREFNNARTSIEGEIREGMREVDLRKLEEKKAEETKV